MKKLLIIFTILHSVYSCAQTVIDLNIYYLPWNSSFEDRIDDAYLRTFKKTQYACIQDTMIIDEFLKSTSMAFFSPFPELKSINPVMVIDMYFENGSRESMALNYRKNVMFQGYYYHINVRLAEWIEKYLPPYRFK
jgi:hypothetical protein